MANKKLYIHIGFAKTGSTSIQLFCQTNRHTLEDRGARYIQSGLIWCIHRNYKKDIQKICNEINHTDFETYILSEEELSFKIDTESLKHLSEKLENCKLIFICYVRPQDQFFESLYFEDIKNTRIAAKPQQYLSVCEGTGKKIDRGNYMEIIDAYKYGLNVAYSDFIVRPFDKNYFLHKNLIVDFISIVCPNLNLEVLWNNSWQNLGFHDVADLNSSKDIEFVEFKRHINKTINRLLIPTFLKTQLANYFRKLLLKSPNKSKDDVRVFFNNEIRKKILSHFQHCNNKLTKIYDIAPSFFNRKSPVLEQFRGLNKHSFLRVITFYITKRI